MLIAHDSWYRKLWAKWFYTPLRWYVHQISALLVDFHFHLLFSAVGSYWQVIWKKFSWNFHFQSKVNICTKFQLSRLIFIFINCYQIKKILEFSCTHKSWYLCKISALLVYFYFHQLLSAGISCLQLLTADDSWYEKKSTGIFMYTLSLILIQN